MAIRRKDALDRLEARVPRVEEHLAKIALRPEDSSVGKWKNEVRNWLREMEEMLPHVGKKTAATWQERIEAYKAALEL